MTIMKIRSNASSENELLREDKDFLRPLIAGALQDVLEAEMTEALGGGKGDRSESRLGHRSGCYMRFLITRIG